MNPHATGDIDAAHCGTPGHACRLYSTDRRRPLDPVPRRHGGITGGADRAGRNSDPWGRGLRALRAARPNPVDGGTGQHSLRLAGDAWRHHCAASQRAHATHHLHQGPVARNARLGGRLRHVAGDGVPAVAGLACVGAPDRTSGCIDANAGGKRSLACQRGPGRGRADAADGSRATAPTVEPKAGGAQWPAGGCRRRIAVPAVARTDGVGQCQPGDLFPADAGPVRGHRRAHRLCLWLVHAVLPGVVDGNALSIIPNRMQEACLT